MANKKVMKLASRGKRFGAACIDLIVPVVAYIVFFSVMAANGIRSNYPYGYGFGNDFGYGYGYGYDYGFNAGSRLSGGSVAVIMITSVLLITYIIVQFVFYAKGKSIGKAALGLQVVSSINGKPFGFWKMMLRECIVKGACGSTFFLGYIWILIDEKNRGWHDKILDSYVVDLKESAKMNRKRAASAAKKAEEAPEAVKVEKVAEEPSAETEDVKPIELSAVKAAAEPVPAAIAEEVPETVQDAGKAPEEAPEKAEEAAPETEMAVDNEIEIESIVVDDEVFTPDVHEEAPAEEAAAEPAPAVSMDMKKAERIEAAREAGVSVSSKATKADIIEAIEKAYSEKE